MSKCKTCDGTGEVHSHNPNCWDCNGTGVECVQLESVPLQSVIWMTGGEGRCLVEERLFDNLYLIRRLDDQRKNDCGEFNTAYGHARVRVLTPARRETARDSFATRLDAQPLWGKTFPMSQFFKEAGIPYYDWNKRQMVSSEATHQFMQSECRK